MRPMGSRFVVERGEPAVAEVVLELAWVERLGIKRSTEPLASLVVLGMGRVGEDLEQPAVAPCAAGARSSSVAAGASSMNTGSSVRLLTSSATCGRQNSALANQSPSAVVDSSATAAGAPFCEGTTGGDAGDRGRVRRPRRERCRPSS